jgi:Golgi transport complex subunit 5
MTTLPAEAEASDPSYIDYEIFLSPSFSASAFANSLVLTTNNPTDTPLDLTTPLSRVLFDIQEVDSHIHTLTSNSALPLLTYTQSQAASSSRILTELSGQVTSLNDSYKRLEKEIVGRYEAAEEVRMVSERLWHTVRLGRAVGRALQLGRQLEVQMNEIQSPSAAVSSTAGPVSKPREDHKAMVRASNTILALRTLFAASSPGEEGEGVCKVHVVTTLRNDILQPSERTLRTKAQQIIREFSVSALSSSTATYAQTEDTKSRTTSALQTLYLLSPLPESTSSHKHTSTFIPDLLLAALQDYIRTALTSSIASLSRALGTLPTLDRTLLEISARCQNLIALETLLESTKPPPLPSAPSTAYLNPQASNSNLPQTQLQLITPTNLLTPFLQALETSSLPSYFWRSLGSSLSPRVHELVVKGGVQARTLKTNRNSIRDAIRECVIRGSVAPGIGAGKGRKRGAGEGTEASQRGEENWEREIAVMVGAIVGALGR